MAKMRDQQARSRQACVLQGGEAVEGMLRRRTVSTRTAQLYGQKAQDFLKAYNLNKDSPISEVDIQLDKELVRVFLLGGSVNETRLVFYGVRWWLTTTNARLPLAAASLKGHQRSERQTMEEPECWEATVLRADALLADPCPPTAEPAEKRALAPVRCSSASTATCGQARRYRR